VTERILIVDDDEPSRMLIRELLCAAGCHVLGEAADGASALREIARLRPTLVILDVQLPDSDGFEVAQRIAADPDPPKVIMVSGRDSVQYRRRIAASPALGFIDKAELSAAAIAGLAG